MSRLFLPGPVDVAPEVLAAQAKPMLVFPGPEYEDLIHRVQEKIRRIFLTQNLVTPIGLSGPGMQEILIRNFVQRRVLCCINGGVSQQWADIAAAAGVEVIALEAEWGEPIFPAEFRAALETHPVDAITLLHVEPTTGVINPLAELAEIAAAVQPEALLMVDASSSLGGIPFDTDGWSIPVVFSEGQECLALPPGLSLLALSNSAFERANIVENRGYAFDLTRFNKLHRQGGLPGIPPLSLIYALDAQCDRILLEGLESRCERHAGLAEQVQGWLQNAGFPLIALPGYQSATLTAFRNVTGWNFTDLDQYLLQRGLRIANGAGMFKDRVFRIALMGEVTQADIEALTLALSEYKG